MLCCAHATRAGACRGARHMYAHTRHELQHRGRWISNGGNPLDSERMMRRRAQRCHVSVGVALGRDRVNKVVHMIGRLDSKPTRERAADDNVALRQTVS